MRANDPEVLAVMRRAMVARIATLSRNGRPSVTPLYFVCVKGSLWLGTSDWTLAARDARADSRVCILLNVERHSRDRRVLRVTGRADVRTDAQMQRAYNVRVVFKYSLTPGGIYNTLQHVRQLRFMHQYHAQSAEKGKPCVIEVTPEQAEFLPWC